MSAPAGFGKSTAVNQWLDGAAAAGRNVAWVSLDAGDSRPESFWTYVVTALARAAPGVGEHALPLLQSARAPVETVLTTVINDLAALPQPLDLVLDDYHLADGPGIRATMAFLIEHLPPQAHLLVCTRADPVLPLALLRARGELTELRAADLRFTPDETAAFLVRTAETNLPAADVSALEQRTEGWIAALQLAALSLRGRQDTSRFIKGFAGDDRYVVDYLVEEVLAHQSAEVRDFLLRTSVLSRLTAPLCDAVTGRRHGTAMLELLDRANLFLVRLDDRRQWYRYHHLFADVLGAHLAAELPDEAATLHARAGRWYEATGETASAVAHALESGEPGRAADLVERAIPALQQQRQEATVHAWVRELPDDIVHARPALALGLTGALLMSRDEPEKTQDRMEEAGQLLDACEEQLAAGEPTVADPGTAPRLPGMLELYRSALALARGNPAATVTHATRALDRATADDHVLRSAASALLGLVRWGEGDLDAAHAAYSAAAEGLRRAGYVPDVLGCSITLADLCLAQGRLKDARHTYKRALRLASGQRSTQRGTPDMYVGLCEVAWEQGDFEAATAHLDKARELGESVGLPQYPSRWRVMAARIRDAEGEHAAALALLDRAAEVHTTDFSPEVRPVPAVRARSLAAQGRLREAFDWARDQGLSTADEPSYAREYEHITLARILLAEQAPNPQRPARTKDTTSGPEKALETPDAFLQRLLEAAERGGRTTAVIEILVLQARAHTLGGDVQAAEASLLRALTLAESEGIARPFLDNTPETTALLRTLAHRHGVGNQPPRLLTKLTPADRVEAGEPGAEPEAEPFVEPLSERELEVLRLLAGDLDGPGIARELHVSVNTLRTHTRHIYTKLGVTNRRAAVRQADRLNLLSSPRSR